MATKDHLAETQQEVRRKFLFHLPRAVDDWAALVHDSDNPKDKLEFVTAAGKYVGLEPKNDSGAGLATFNVVINMHGVSATLEKDEVVEVVPVEKPTMLLPDDPSEAAQPAPEKPALALEILPLDD